ncbi:MAG: alpha/beta hydrolase [Chloroflexota bacterium]
MPTVEANGLEIHYTVEGEGPPLVLLHGATSSALEDWSAQRPLFRQHFTVYLVDARGHARTRPLDPSDPLGGWSRDRLVDDLGAFADALGLDTFHAGGFSMGAMTVLAFATRHPERLRSAIVAGISVEREPRARVALRLMDPDRIERDEPAWAAQLDRRHTPAQGPGGWKPLLRTIAHDIATQPLLTMEELRAARVPVLLVVGDRDVFVPLDHAVRLHRQLPDSRLLVVPDSGHVVTVTQPALFNQAATTFWRSLEAPEGTVRARPSGTAAILRSGEGGGTG